MKSLRKLDFRLVGMEIILHTGLFFLIQGIVMAAILKRQEVSFLLFFLLFGQTYAYIARKMANHIWVFLIHTLFLVMLSWALYQGHLVSILNLIDGIMIAMQSMVLRFSKGAFELECPGYYQIGMISAIYFLAVLCKAEWLQKDAVIFVIVSVLFKVIYDGIISTQTFIDLQKHTAFVPIQQIKTVNAILMTVYVGITLFFMFFFQLFPLDKILGGVEAFFLYFIRKILSILFQTSPVEAQPEPVTESSTNFSDYLKPGTTSPIWDMIFHVVQVIVIVFLIVLVVAGIFYAFYQWYQNFYTKKRKDKDLMEFISPFETQKLRYKNRKKQEHRGRSNNINGKIRKLYRKRIKAGIGKDQILANHLTPSEQGKVAKLPEDLRTEELLNNYYAARYREEACSKESLKEMKELCKL